VKREETVRVAEVNIICIGCPMGCTATLTIGGDGEITAIVGCECKAGQKYVVEEYKNPVRVLTATVVTQGSPQPLLPVRTAAPILKMKLMLGMGVLAKARVKPPVKIGDVVIPNLLGTGVDVVATSDLAI
jgi:CxxC motif-containing protein